MVIKQKFLIAGGIIMFCVLASLMFMWHHKKQQAKPLGLSSALVQLSPVTITTLPQTTTASAHLVALKETTITPRVAGYIAMTYCHEGERIEAGKTLFQLDDQKEKDALRAAIASNQLSSIQYAREKKLLAQGFITHAEYYTAKVTMQQNQAALQIAKENLSDKTIIAPFTGTLGSCPISVGNYVTPGTALTTLVDTKHLRAEYDVPANLTGQLALGQPVFIAAEKNTLVGTVSYIAPSVNINSQTISVHALIDNHADIFKPGEFVTARQTIGAIKNAILVPEQSLIASLHGYAVYTVKNGKATEIPVKIGARNNGFVQITHGLAPRIEIITVGQSELRDGQNVTIQNTHKNNRV